jgi:hypothetical protein
MAHRALKASHKRAAVVTRLMWGGFSDGKLDVREIEDGWGGENRRQSPMLFTSRKAARQQYEDVRRVRVSSTLTKG